MTTSIMIPDHERVIMATIKQYLIVQKEVERQIERGVEH